MGRGDLKTKKGKISNGSYGKHRNKKNKKSADQVFVKANA